MAVEPQDREQEIRFRALRDEAFREALLKHPKETLEREYGVTVPEHWKVHVHEETEGVVHFVIPGRVLPGGQRVPEDALDDTIETMMSHAKTSCCTCGSSTEQSLSSLQAGCGC